MILLIIIILISVAFLIGGTILGVKKDYDACFIIGLLVCVLNLTGLRLYIPSINSLDYYIDIYENKQIIEEELSRCEDLSTNLDLYQRILEFNKDLTKCKENYDSWWNGCFYNDDVATKISYIEFEEPI